MTLSLSRCSGAFACLMILVACLVNSMAQGGVGSTRGLPDSGSGIHTISGRVYLPSGQRAGPGVIIKLEGNVNGTRRVATDTGGSFIFTGLPAADYTLVVDGGDDYNPTRQSVIIYGNTGGSMAPTAQTIQLDIHLQQKGNEFDEAKFFAGVPKTAIDAYKKGMQFAQAGNSKKAIEQLNAAVLAYPGFTNALRELGVQYLKSGDMNKLAETMEALLKVAPDDVGAHLNLGIALYNQKKFAEAETHLREAVKLNGADAAAHYYLGMTIVGSRQSKLYPEAESELELAIKNGGQNLPLAHKYLGGLYMSSNKSQQAADELEKYLKLEPKAADADRIKGTIKDLRSKQQ